jgi:hypothetical protein
MQVERVGPGGTPIAPRKGAKAAGFSQLLETPEQGDVAPAGEAAPAEAPVAARVGGLMTYEEARDRVLADRQARRHGRAMLQALGAMQLSLLAGGDAAVQALADLAAQVPEADDPVLRLLLQEIGVRAAVELARHADGVNISTG